jgi:hypothetical protein
MEEKMKNTKRIFGLGLLALSLSMFTACGNILDSISATNSSGKDGLVRIYLGAQSAGARTVQPGQDALAGYRLTFVGDSETPRDPVDITGVDYADVYLADGTWTITAKAYKLGGTIGEESDKIAEGSITVTLSDGAVEGAASAIILRSSAVGNGTLHYSITLPTGVTGSLKLWDISDTAVIGFGNNGVFTFAASLTGDYPLAAGRYIAEASLTNHAGGGVGFRREVVEIWADTVSDFIFAPAEFLDPNAGRMEEGIYIGILSFDQTTHDIAVPTLLNSTSRTTLKNEMDTVYTKSASNGTLLYYSVHKALNSIKAMESRLPDNTQSINIITFTDGVDVGSISPILWNNSPLAGFDFHDDVTGDEYLTWLHEQLVDTQVKNNSITASAYGVAGEDVNLSDMDLFEANIASLATESGEHNTSIQFSELSEKFGEIAAGLIDTKTNTSFDLLLTPPSGGNGTVFKMTFDNITDADLSTEWFTGEYRYSSGTYTLSNLQYDGIESQEGYSPLPSSLTGTVVGSEVKYHFDSLNLLGIPLTERNTVQQWFKNPSASNWQHNGEYDKGDAASSTTEQSTAVIYLILDSSRSLSESNAGEIRNAAKSFIDVLYQKYEETITYTVTTANTITGGTVSATPTGGPRGTTVTLSNTPGSGYFFGGYTVNGTAISGNSFTLNGNVVVSGVFNTSPPPSIISNIFYSGSWTLESDGRYRSPAIGNSQTTKCRVDFTSTGSNNQLVIALDVSSESGYDFAFVGALNSTASYSSYFDRISGAQSKTITIPVPNPGSHFVEIGYGKDGSQVNGSDCAWFKIVN